LNALRVETEYNHGYFASEREKGTLPSQLWSIFFFFEFSSYQTSNMTISGAEVAQSV